jgi:antitoxin component YwqK of YwqJK toxin-antitoxin module
MIRKNIITTLRINIIVALLCCAGVESCSHKPQYYRTDDSTIRLVNDMWYQGNEPLTGMVYQCSPKGDTLFLQEVRAGKPDGTTTLWYPRTATGTQQVQEIRLYAQGKREGVHTGYWQNGNKKFEYTYTNDLHHGIQKEWYANGSPYRVATYHEGYEHGLQQAFTDDGLLSVNYDARNGRNYGNIGKKRCRTVWAHGGLPAPTQADTARASQAVRSRGGM